MYTGRWETGLQKMGPVGPDGFAQNIFGWTKENINSQQIGNNSQQIGTNVANPIDKDNIISDAKQIKLTNMQACGAPSRREGAPLASIFVSWICKESPIIGLCH